VGSRLPNRRHRCRVTSIRTRRPRSNGAQTTDAIPVDRGSIQGDSLSPFLFLIYIEPLLRWLHVGGQGYMHGCLAQKTMDERLKRRQRRSVRRRGHPHKYVVRPASAGTQTEQLLRLGARCKSTWAKQSCQGITQTDTRAWRHNTQVSIQPGRTAADWPHQSSGATSHIPDPREPFTYLGWC
jgi:hypothetical protein